MRENKRDSLNNLILEKDVLPVRRKSTCSRSNALKLHKTHLSWINSKDGRFALLSKICLQRQKGVHNRQHLTSRGRSGSTVDFFVQNTSYAFHAWQSAWITHLITCSLLTPRFQEEIRHRLRTVEALPMSQVPSHLLTQPIGCERPIV